MTAAQVDDGAARATRVERAVVVRVAVLRAVRVAGAASIVVNGIGGGGGRKKSESQPHPPQKGDALGVYTLPDGVGVVSVSAVFRFAWLFSEPYYTLRSARIRKNTAPTFGRRHVRS